MQAASTAKDIGRPPPNGSSPRPPFPRFGTAKREVNLEMNSGGKEVQSATTSTALGLRQSSQVRHVLHKPGVKRLMGGKDSSSQTIQ